MRIAEAAKKVIRPLVPDRVMARYRLHQHSRGSRVNVDVFVEDPRSAKRWLVTTPDTYRVRLGIPFRSPVGDSVEISDGRVPEETVEKARTILADLEIDVAVVGEVMGPRLIDRRRAEPAIGPRLIMTTEEVIAEVGGVPLGTHPLPGLLARVRDAGRRIGLLPITPSGAPTERSDPIGRNPVVILAAVPMHDVGGGARSTQLALELLKQGHHVTVVSLYDSQESVDLGLRFIHPDLEQHNVRSFDATNLLSRVPERGLILVEAPAGPLVDHARGLQSAGWELIYDVIDDWSDPELGGDWYRRDIEEELIQDSDRIVASAPDLVEKVRSLGRDAELVPNGVNAELFGGTLPPRPTDLPESAMVIGYHGSLYGEWFDWASLREVAEAFPDAAVLLIGDDKAPHPPMPQNVHYLGLKPQADLPAYVQRFDVGIIPFKVNEMTHAVSPLKAYEYLASGVPVAAPPLRALEGLEGVVTGPLVSAVRDALGASTPDRGRAIKDHSWTARIASMVTAQKKSDNEMSIPKTVIRPAVHYDKNSRVHIARNSLFE